MEQIGMIGLGNMGIGLAQNIIQSGFGLTGFDLRDERLKMLEDLGGQAADSPKAVGEQSDAVFVMVLNGKQVYEVVTGEDGLLQSMKPGSTIIVSATIQPSEVRAIEEPILAKGVHLMDTPVSGGKSGADSGTLTMMAAAPKAVFEANYEVLQAVGEEIFHVSEEIGIGQTVKAALQAFIGASFTAIFESLVLGSKAGVKGETLFKVFGASGVSSPLFRNCAELIMDRKFKDTGSHIGTMYKDLSISMALAKENGVAMFTTSAAYELFQSGISLFPEEDNWSIVKLLEQIAGTEVKW
ncbi:MAG: NAD(P)-dependent oxidoreductase [bacterium]|nr:NAD(P)-dependent oxidoreductase [bacterium]